MIKILHVVHTLSLIHISVKLVDLVGGIDLYLTAEETHQKIRDLQIDGDDGVYHLNGQQVKEYCRIRTIDDDFHRMKRQNTVIMAILTELRTKNFWELMDICLLYTSSARSAAFRARNHM